MRITLLREASGILPQSLDASAPYTIFFFPPTRVLVRLTAKGSPDRLSADLGQAEIKLNAILL